MRKYLSSLHTFLMTLKKDILVLILMGSLVLNALMFNPDLFRRIYEDIGEIKTSSIIHIPKESQYNIMRQTGADVFITFKFNHNVPKTMSMVNLLTKDVQIDHIPNQQIPVKGIPELVFSLMNDECYAELTENVRGFILYNLQELKYLVACPIVDEHRELRGFSLLMFKQENSNNVGYHMSQLRKLTKPTQHKRDSSWD